jgi:Leucine-rich repeat (LRR) protein
MNKILIIIIIILAGTVALMALRGDEDTWVCEQGKWAKHGNPSAPAPQEPCGVESQGGIEGYVDTLTKGLEQAKDINRQSYTVDLSGQGLTSLSTEYFEGKQEVKVFNVSNNALTGALPAEIRKMESLEELNASNNDLTGIPAEIGQMKRIQRINFSGNRINTYPNEFANIKNNLKSLNLTGNPFTPAQIAELQAMLPNTEIIFL